MTLKQKKYIEKYKEYLAKWNSLTEKEDDEFCDILDDMWFDMTDEEIGGVDENFYKWKKKEGKSIWENIYKKKKQ